MAGQQPITWMPAMVSRWRKRGGTLMIMSKRLAKTIQPKSKVEVLVKMKDGTIVEVVGRVAYVGDKTGIIGIHLSSTVAQALDAGPALAAVKNYDVLPSQDYDVPPLQE